MKDKKRSIMKKKTKEKTQNKKNFRIKLLDDSPVTEDEFGTHEKIADNILHIINSQVGSKAIALIGSWGSGKSSVIEMLKNKIKNFYGDKIGIFIFDSWEHEGEALRKGFIEKLIKFLIIKKWLHGKEEDNVIEIEDKNLNKKYKNLKGIMRTEEITSKPKLSKWKKFFIFLLYLVPIGLLLLSVGLNALFGKADMIPEIWLKIGLIIIGSMFLLSPIFEIIILWICQKRGKFKDESLISIFFERKIDSQITERKYETPDPSSLEFEDLYKSTLKESLKEEKKLIVVIDNLDRVSPSTALRLLSTIKPFIQFKDKEEKDEIFEKVWYIIPFDKNSLERLWRFDRDNHNKDFAHSFIEKIFQIKFNIPPIILSNWKQYFNRKLSEASHNYFDDNTTYKIRSIFELLYFQRKEKDILPPTPRFIKLFINNFLISYSSRMDIEPEIHALFVFLRDFCYKYDFNNLPNKIKNEKFEYKRKLLPYLPENWEMKLLSLFYKVEQEEVLSILYEREIENAILNCDESFIDENISKKGFEEAIEKVINDNISEWIKFKPYLIGYSAKLFKNNDRLLRITYNHFKKVKNLKGLDKNAGEGISILIRKFGEDEEMIDKILEILKDINSNLPEKVKGEKDE